jgi:pilus assembly protein CpaE
VSVQAFCETVETAAAVQAAGEDRRLAKAHVKAGSTSSRNAATPAPA